MKNYKIRQLDSHTITYFKNCFDSNGSPKILKKIEWQFFHNTEKKNYVDIAYDDDLGQTAAIYAISAVKFKVGNDFFTASQSLDTITDVNYRGKGLFVDLAKDVYEKASKDGVVLVYGFPNGNSIHGFTKKLEWQVLDPLPFLIKPLRTKYFTNKIKYLKFLPNIKLPNNIFAKKRDKFILNEKKHFPNEVDLIWNQFSETFSVGIVRNQKYLNWRYIQKPDENYKILHCYTKTKEYLGFIVYVVKNKHEGKIGYIMELMCDPKNKKVANDLLSSAINKIRNEEADCILAWSLEHSVFHSIFKNNFFFNMPEKIRPIELHFGAKAFRDDLKEMINERKNWYISYSDSDTV